MLAAAGGIVHQFTNDTCGLSIKITHDSIGRSVQYPNKPQTVYCHLQEYAVQDGARVERGALIGKVGLTGTAGGVSHLHLEYWEKPPHLGVGNVLPDGALDPHSVMAGCFEPGREYPKDRLVLTYPVMCR